MTADIFGDENTYVKVFNPEVQGQVLGNYKNFRRAAGMLGVPITSLKTSCKKRERIFSVAFQKEVAPRLVSRTPDVKFD